MASLEKQKASILDLLDRGLARAVRVIESRKIRSDDPRAVSRITAAIQTSEPQLIQLIIDRKPVAGVEPDLYESWMVKSLSEARHSIDTINPRNVRSTRRARQPTRDIFDRFILAAAKKITDPISGVENCIRECFTNQDRYKPEGVEELANLSKLASTVRRRLRIFRSRTLSTLLSGWFLSLLILVALISVPTLYYIDVYQRSGAPSLSDAAPAVAQSVKADAQKMRSAVSAPDANPLQKTATIVELLWKILDNASKILGASAAAWAAFRAWATR